MNSVLEFGINDDLGLFVGHGATVVGLVPAPCDVIDRHGELRPRDHVDWIAVILGHVKLDVRMVRGLGAPLDHPSLLDRHEMVVAAFRNGNDGERRLPPLTLGRRRREGV
jgi:hypothetical protein